jgi:hypothetical protein
MKNWSEEEKLREEERNEKYRSEEEKGRYFPGILQRVPHFTALGEILVSLHIPLTNVRPYRVDKQLSTVNVPVFVVTLRLYFQDHTAKHILFWQN